MGLVIRVFFSQNASIPAYQSHYLGLAYFVIADDDIFIFNFTRHSKTPFLFKFLGLAFFNRKRNCSAEDYPRLVGPVRPINTNNFLDPLAVDVGFETDQDVKSRSSRGLMSAKQLEIQ